MTPTTEIVDVEVPAASRRPLIVGAVAAAVVLAGIALALLTGGDDDTVSAVGSPVVLAPLTPGTGLATDGSGLPLDGSGVAADATGGAVGSPGTTPDTVNRSARNPFQPPEGVVLVVAPGAAASAPAALPLPLAPLAPAPVPLAPLAPAPVPLAPLPPAFVPVAPYPMAPVLPPPRRPTVVRPPRALPGPGAPAPRRVPPAPVVPPAVVSTPEPGAPYAVTLGEVTGAGQARRAAFKVDGVASEVKVGERFGRHDELLLIALNDRVTSWIAVVQIRSRQPVDVPQGRTLHVR